MDNNYTHLNDTMDFARFAPVVPWKIAQQLKDRGALGGYHLLLAHDVIDDAKDNPRHYNEVYMDCGTETDPKLIIMDNSVIELGRPVGVDALQRAVEIVGAQVFVLPDELLLKDATVKATLEGLETYRSVRESMNCEAMAVPQGSTYDEWVECLEEFAKYPEIEWLGIPRNVREKLGRSRVDACDVARLICPDKKLHLLGFSETITDDLKAARDCIVYGIDSAVPIRIAISRGMTLDIHNDDQDIPKRGEWWDNPGIIMHKDGIAEYQSLDLAIENMASIRESIK